MFALIVKRFLMFFLNKSFLKKVLDKEWNPWYYPTRGLEHHAMSRGSEDQ